MSALSMSADRPRVLVAARVPCEPGEAFARFTTEIGQWWRPNPLFQFSEGRTGTLAFESGEGGRLIETYDDGTTFVIGVISIWAPPWRLVLSWSHASFPPDLSTELHVTFESTEPGQTRVTIEHYGWDTIPTDHAARHNIAMTTFQLRFAEWWRLLLEGAFPPR
jgi:uncharacterized protein YndB with AHSA1/START domain